MKYIKKKSRKLVTILNQATLSYFKLFKSVWQHSKYSHFSLRNKKVIKDFNSTCIEKLKYIKYFLRKQVLFFNSILRYIFSI